MSDNTNANRNSHSSPENSTSEARIEHPHCNGLCQLRFPQILLRTCNYIDIRLWCRAFMHGITNARDMIAQNVNWNSFTAEENQSLAVPNIMSSDQNQSLAVPNITSSDPPVNCPLCRAYQEGRLINRRYSNPEESRNREDMDMEGTWYYVPQAIRPTDEQRMQAMMVNSFAQTDNEEFEPEIQDTRPRSNVKSESKPSTSGGTKRRSSNVKDSTPEAKRTMTVEKTPRRSLRERSRTPRRSSSSSDGDSLIIRRPQRGK